MASSTLRDLPAATVLAPDDLLYVVTPDGDRKVSVSTLTSGAGSIQYDIGTAGTIGFGVAAIPDSMLPVGWTKLSGHNDRTHQNFGNVVDPNGSVMVWIPAFYFRWDANALSISSTWQEGFVLHRAFIDDGEVKSGFFVDKYGCGIVSGKFVAQQGIDPASTAAAHNPISALTAAPANNYGGLYAAAASRGSGFSLPSIFMYNALAMLAYAHGKAAVSTAACAYIDVLPKMPKGNNNNALKDGNDASVTFTASGYSNCALTGSGVPFAKTTHNGQACGVADLNGNIWEVASGFVKFGAADAVFAVLKQSVTLSSIQTDSTTGGGAYDPTLYDSLDLTGIIVADTTTKFGNGSETVFEMSTDVTSQAYKKTCSGIPLANGKSVGGTTDFGSDYLREYWRDQMAPMVGGHWAHGSPAGVFTLNLHTARPHSSDAVGGRASYLV